MKKYKKDLGNPNLVICLDAGATNNQSIFVTTTLRGIMAFDLTVTTGLKGMHSGYSGAWPQPWPLMNKLLSRLINPDTQMMNPQF
jgi:acetylornithine deacetylase/succinyl-diaminopimelate desuccinylase-like protein